jgi:hypothetical protein
MFAAVWGGIISELREKAKESQATSTGGSTPQLLATLQKAEPVHTHVAAAAQANVSPCQYVKDALPYREFTASQRAMTFADIDRERISELREKAKESQGVRTDLLATLPISQPEPPKAPQHTHVAAAVQANVSPRTMQDAIKVRAERKLGEILRQSAEDGSRATRETFQGNQHQAAMSKSTTYQNADTQPPPAPKPVTLSEIGITRDQSSRIAAVTP